jgi:2,4-didehydro-3-deoxy-L-rhamnonate hydrolase
MNQPTWPFALGMFRRGAAQPFVGLVDPQYRVCALQDLLADAPWPADLPPPTSLFALLQQWDTVFPRLQQLAPRLAEPSLRKQPMADLTALAPVAEARQLICTGANYRNHVIDLVAAQGAGAESEGQSVEERREHAARRVDERARNGIPYAFPKLVGSICGPQDPIAVPRDSEQFDWELELGVVIGREAWRVPVERAMEYIAGYTVVNDLTRRELVYRPDLKSLGSDWLRAKSGPGFFPMGPLLVPAAFVDPMNLRLLLQVNDETMQDESTSDMLWDVARQIAYVSSYAKLLPGDVLATGSPAGNGMHHGRFLRPGDVMRGEIEGLGMQVNRMVAEGEL